MATTSVKLTKRQKHYQDVLKGIEPNGSVTLSEGMGLLKQAVAGVSKFDEAIECHVRLGIDMKHAEQQIRTTVVLPEGTGKTVRVLVIAKGEKVKEAGAAGADFAGGEEMLEKIEKENWLDFDVMISTPDMMAQVGKLGRMLGPKGLMPNPKTGTVSFDVAKAVRDVKAGQVEIRPDKEGIVHVPIGRLRFDEGQLKRNFSALYDTILRAKPSAVKGTYVRSVTLSSTMGPGIKLDPGQLGAEIKDYLSA